MVEVAGADVDNAPVRSSRRGFVNVARILAIAFAAVGVVLIVLGLIL